MSQIDKMQIRDAFIHGVIERAENDKDIIIISNDFGSPALDRFREEYSNQFVNAGISEQNIISVAAGMANEGKKVFVYSIASFITLRCLEQIKLDICIHNAPVTIMAGGTGLSYAEDGPTHHAIEDIALMRLLSGMEIYSPSDGRQAYNLAKECANKSRPAYIRMDKGAMPLLDDRLDLSYKGFRTRSSDSGLLLISYGFMSHKMLEVADKLDSSGIPCTPIDLTSIHPTSSELKEMITKAKFIVTIEEHSIIGGLGSIIAEILVESNSCAVLKRFAIDTEMLYDYGTRDYLHDKFQLSTTAMVSSILKWKEENNAH